MPSMPTRCSACSSWAVTPVSDQCRHAAAVTIPDADPGQHAELCCNLPQGHAEGLTPALAAFTAFYGDAAVWERLGAGRRALWARVADAVVATLHYDLTDHISWKSAEGESK